MTIRLLTPSREQMAHLRTGPEQFAGLAIAAGALPPDFIFARAEAALARGEPVFWSSPRLFVLDEIATIVGTGGYKGLPADGQVEIGYNVAPSWQGRGHATSAIALLVRDALREPGLGRVLAETSVANIGSRRALEKAGFTHAGQRKTEDDGVLDRWLRGC